MLQRLMLVLALVAMVGFAVAQSNATPPAGAIIPVDLIAGALDDQEDQIAKGVDTASVDQTIVLNLPRVTALHLAAQTITFDLAYLNGEGWEARAGGDLTDFQPQYECVYVQGDDVRWTPNNAADFFGQQWLIPGGVAYKTPAWPYITLAYADKDTLALTDVGAEDRVVTYPPIRLDADGKLIDGSKDYFVCYQTFIMQLFANWGDFDLQVERNDLTGQGIEHLYIQANPCPEFGTATGLYALDDGEPAVHLLPKSLTAGPTGARNLASGCNPNSSWMDVLGVIAVKVNADLFGESVADLTYTLLDPTPPEATATN